MRYKVVGNHTFDGTPPGRTVIVKDEARAHRYVRAGVLAPVKEEVKTDGDVRSD